MKWIVELINYNWFKCLKTLKSLSFLYITNQLLIFLKLFSYQICNIYIYKLFSTFTSIIIIIFMKKTYFYRCSLLLLHYFSVNWNWFQRKRFKNKMNKQEQRCWALFLLLLLLLWLHVCSCLLVKVKLGWNQLILFFFVFSKQFIFVELLLPLSFLLLYSFLLFKVFQTLLLHFFLKKINKLSFCSLSVLLFLNKTFVSIEAMSTN